MAPTASTSQPPIPAGGGGGPAQPSKKVTGGGGAGGGGAGAGKPGGKKDKGDKKTRSRAACVACKSTKQRCDGPSRVPCRRCELYGLECKFPTTANVVLAYPPQPQKPPGEANATSSADNGLVTQKLFEIAARLQTIESALNVNQPGGGFSQGIASSHSASQVARSISEDGSDDEMMMLDQDGGSNSDQRESRARANPIMMINETVVGVVGKPPLIASELDYGSPDVLKRGVLTAEECQELFEFFFASIHPWVMMLSLDDDRDALGVRSRSSLLFHTILLLSTSYSTPFPSQLHTTLITFTNSILAPQILSPQPHELTTDFLRAIDLLNLYKPTQLSARRAEGLDDAEAMRCSKVNGLASWMLQGILGRTAERLELAGVLNKFSRAYSASSSGAPIPKQVVRDLRLYYWLLSNDVHGNVQSGRRCNMEGAAALTTTRLFSSLQLQPYDTRLAASVEMFEVARPILRSFSYERTRKIARADLERYNTGMKVWDEFWCPILIQQLAVDPLAMSVLCPFQWFITLTYNASAYTNWKQNRMYSSDSGGETSTNPLATADVKPPRRVRADGVRGLSEWEYSGLQKCVQAAESLIFTLSEESRVRNAWRAVQWEEAERSDGWRKLVMDQSVVELARWGMDAITCINFVFPLVFLSRLVTDGVLTAELVLIRTPTAQPPWRITQKLPRLLELGSQFLDSIASSPVHPARAQAQLIRTILDAGLKGTSPSPGGQLPRHAQTVMSPLPVPQPSLFPAPQNLQHQHQTQQSHQQPPQQPPQQPWRSGNANIIQSYPSPTDVLGGRAPTGVPTTGMDQNGMDTALAAALDGFDPLFGDSTAFWEWGGPGMTPGGPDGTWNALRP
ncbi:hypothetical protein T439DRAFT_324173 [Meredithblackwellia eburnea MCA 4105]